MFHVEVYADGHPWHLENIYAGLLELSHSGEIDLSFTYPGLKPRADIGIGDVSLWMNVKDSESGRAVKVCFDLHDKSDYIRYERLKSCDIYFKRSYFQPDLNPLESKLQEKIFPLGFKYGCRSKHDKSSLARILGYFISKYIHNNNVVFPPTKSLFHLAYLFKLYYSSPIIQDFEVLPSQDKLPVVLFQTRVWAPSESKDNVKEINEERISTIRELKSAFGDKFIGGVMPSKFALQNYPEEVTNFPTDRKSFIDLVKSSLIGVYTRGLSNSVACKFPEYLAASSCIVSTPIRNELPSPLMPSKHYLEFSSTNECVMACQQLLKNPQMASQMRINNHNYYLTEVEPSAHVLKCLRQAFDTISA